MTRAVMAWSSGKDCAYALWQVRKTGDPSVVAILTTVTEDFDRVSMHAVREQVLDLQARALGLPCIKVKIPFPCPDGVYEQRMSRAMQDVSREGVREVVFGDLFLEDVRQYRERNLASVGMRARFPLWKIETTELASRMMADGIRAIVTAVDPSKLDASFAGRAWDARMLEDLPAGVDPCGENGEFHTVVIAGPMFDAPLAVEVGEIVTRDGFVFADVLPR